MGSARVTGRARRWWSRLSTRSRERILLGALVGVGLAARDLLLLASSASAFAALELTDLLGTPASAKPAA